MPATIYIEETIQVGKEIVLPCDSPLTQNGVVFEDDGTTGYFYGVEFKGSDFSIVDAMHIYNVKDVTDKDRPSIVEIAWTEDGLKAALYINDYPHAVFDFESKNSYCRTNFPPPEPDWTGHEWSEAALDFFI